MTTQPAVEQAAAPDVPNAVPAQQAGGSPTTLIASPQVTAVADTTSATAPVPLDTWTGTLLENEQDHPLLSGEKPASARFSGVTVGAGLVVAGSLVLLAGVVTVVGTRRR